MCRDRDMVSAGWRYLPAPSKAEAEQIAEKQQKKDYKKKNLLATRNF